MIVVSLAGGKLVAPIINRIKRDTYLTILLFQKLNFSFNLSEIGGKINAPIINNIMPNKILLSIKAYTLKSNVITAKIYFATFIKSIVFKINNLLL